MNKPEGPARVTHRARRSVRSLVRCVYLTAPLSVVALIHLVAGELVRRRLYSIGAIEKKSARCGARSCVEFILCSVRLYVCARTEADLDSVLRNVACGTIAGDGVVEH